MKFAKLWGISFLIVFLLLLAGVSGITVYVDPFFHYHAPIDGLAYPLYSSAQRYQNDGIARHFDYDTLITGTSMTENFKTTDCDRFFECKSIKVPFSGGSFKEISEHLERALEANPNLKRVIRSLDCNYFLLDKDIMFYEGIYPTYLTDDNLWNDVKYVFNKDVLFGQTKEVLDRTKAGGTTTSFDEYSSWYPYYTFSEAAVLATHQRAATSYYQSVFDDLQKKNVYETVTQNITAIAEKYPDTTFYLFFTPYSAYYWDTLNQNGTLSATVDAFEYATELMLEYDNIKVFSFFDYYRIICNPNYYKDTSHYRQDVNSWILEWMSFDRHLLTKENYQLHWNQVESFYSNYVYTQLYDGK